MLTWNFNIEELDTPRACALDPIPAFNYIFHVYSFSVFRDDFNYEDIDDRLVTGDVYNIKLALFRPRSVFKSHVCILWPSYSDFRRDLDVDDTGVRLVTGDVFNIKLALLGPRSIFKSPLGILWPIYSHFRRDLGIDDTYDQPVTGHVFRLIAKNCETH